jgi:general secretion pathway protein G
MSKRSRVWFMLGIATILLLLAVSVPMYRTAIRSTREKTLAVNLTSLRDVIRQYTKDKQRAPQSLQELVDAGYYRQLPLDPITNSDSTWQPVIETVALSPEKSVRGITDVHSGSDLVSSKGTEYRTW